MADYLLDSGLVIRHLRNAAQAVALLRELGGSLAHSMCAE